nr:hypothetical protein [Tanacetum cinerariifolium]
GFAAALAVLITRASQSRQHGKSEPEHCHQEASGRPSTGSENLPEEAQPYEAQHVPNQTDLRRREVYTAHSNPRGFIYQNKDKKNRLMRIDELHKFSDGTLNDVRNALDDRLKGIRMQYLPSTIWRKGDKNRAAATGKDNMTLSYLLSTHFRESKWLRDWLKCGSTKDRPFILLYWSYKVVKF